jgi:hypothetical protein
MSEDERSLPKLRTVSKTNPKYPLNQFTNEFAVSVGSDIIRLLATKGKAELEGQEWERIFAEAIGAKWKPSQVGLDDVVLGKDAWGLKTIKATSPRSQRKVRLISGRNSPQFSFSTAVGPHSDPNSVGNMVLDIWNTRVSEVRAKYSNLRTCVLIKANDLSEVVIFEFETIMYPETGFQWQWNPRGNLEGFSVRTGEHTFTWQPHGSQFTIIEEVPDEVLLLELKKPSQIDKSDILKFIGFDLSWIRIIRHR